MDKRVSDKLMLIICGVVIVIAIVLTVSYVLIREHASTPPVPPSSIQFNIQNKI